MKVLRTNLSTYNADDFRVAEKKLLESIPNIQYFCAPQLCDAPDIIITNTHTDPEKRSEINWEQVKLIIHPNSGYDNFPADWVKKCRAPIVLGNRIRAHAVINYTLSALFHAYSSIPFSKQWDKGRAWNRTLLNETNVLLIGHGMIGSVVAKSIEPLVKTLSVYDPFKGFNHIPQKSIDTIILCASLNQTSHHIINKAFLDAVLKDTKQFVLINGARGSLVSEDELLPYLENSSASIYLDVFEQEPNDFKKFDHLNNVFKTSHIAGVYTNLDKQIITFSHDVILQFTSRPQSFETDFKDEILQNRYHQGMLI